MYWSPSSRTALAEAELEYNERHISKCAFVRFPLVRLPHVIAQASDIKSDHISALIWTTTPWTLPANKAIAVHADLSYCLIEIPAMPEFGQMLVCRERIDHLKSLLASDVQINVITEMFKGSDIAGETDYINIFQGAGWIPQKIIDAKFVSATSGTGLVHLAPGHGLEDYNACKELGLDFKSPVNESGCFTADAYPENPKLLEGKNVFREGMQAVINFLENPPSLKIGDIELWGSHVLATHQIEHKYPLDWRTKRPLIVRATAQWFADIEGVREEAVETLNSVHFIPESVKTRLESFIKGRNYWCISRQRAWGVPIPALYRVDDGSNSAVMTKDTISHINTVFNMRGTDAWWSDAEDDPAWIPPFLEGTYIRGKDTMDVWFDSGSSWTLLEKWHGHKPVADVYLEGTDQHRGWFQSSLLTYFAFYDWGGRPAQAPFAKLITHGFTLDHKGRKMSKSLGNVVHPEEIMTGSLFPPPAEGKNVSQHSGNEKKRLLKGSGTDVLRLWVAGHDYTNDIRINESALKSIHGNLQKYRITIKWLLGVLDDYNSSSVVSKEAQDFTNDHRLLDEIALYQLKKSSETVHRAYKEYEFYKAVIAINKYVNQDLSAFYFEAVKDRVYAGTLHDRISAQKVLVVILNELLLMLAPITPLLVEETFDYMSMHVRHEGEHPLRRIWTPAKSFIGIVDDTVAKHKTREDLEITIQILEDVQNAIKQAQEKARLEKKIGSGLECDVRIILPTDCSDVVQRVLSTERAAELAAMFVVSKLDVQVDCQKGTSIESLAFPTASAEPSRSTKAFWMHESEFQAQSSSGKTGKVIVTPGSKYKCPRCWRLVARKKDSVCERCDGVMKGVDTKAVI